MLYSRRLLLLGFAVHVFGSPRCRRQSLMDVCQYWQLLLETGCHLFCCRRSKNGQADVGFVCVDQLWFLRFSKTCIILKKRRWKLRWIMILLLPLQWLDSRCFEITVEIGWRPFSECSYELIRWGIFGSWPCARPHSCRIWRVDLQFWYKSWSDTYQRILRIGWCCHNKMRSGQIFGTQSTTTSLRSCNLQGFIPMKM